MKKQLYSCDNQECEETVTRGLDEPFPPNWVGAEMNVFVGTRDGQTKTVTVELHGCSVECFLHAVAGVVEMTRRQ